MTRASGELPASARDDQDAVGFKPVPTRSLHVAKRGREYPGAPERALRPDSGQGLAIPCHGKSPHDGDK
jgi:hypothetical protein